MTNNRGQSLIMFTLSVAALMAILISTVLITISSLSKEVDRLKVRINTYQVTIQMAQIVQSARDLGQKDTTCTAFTGLQQVVVSGKHLCMPASVPCIFNRFCLAGAAPSYVITSIDKIEPEDNFQTSSDGLEVAFSFLPKAEAQSETISTRASLASAPTSNITTPTCPDSARRCVICTPAAGANAECFKIRICTNFSSSCPSQDNYYEAQIGLVFQK